MMNETKTETAEVQDRNSGMEDRNEEEELRRQREGITTIKNKKSNQKHKSKPETMNQREYEEVIFGDEIPEESVISITPKKKRERKAKKVVDDEVVAEEVVPQIAIPLSMDDNYFGTQRVDAEAEEDNVEEVKIMTEEDCLLAEAEEMIKKANELKKRAKKQLAEKEARENIAELRKNHLRPRLARIEKLEQELAELRQEVEDIESGEADESIIEDVIEAVKVKEIASKKVPRTPRTKEKRKPLGEVLNQGDKVVLKRNHELYATWDGVRFVADDVNQESGKRYFRNLNQVNLYHHIEILELANEPNAWKAYVLVRVDSEDLIVLDEVFLN